MVTLLLLRGKEIGSGRIRWAPMGLILWGILVLSGSLGAVERWEYRWGDSPMVDGQPEWVEAPEDAAWRAVAEPLDPPGRDGRNNLWLRALLPEELGPRAYLYITSIDLIGEIYHDGELIYRHGSFDEAGRGEFVGWPWHVVPLPADGAGEWLYFRIYSDYPDIGLWGEVRIDEAEPIYRKMLRRDLWPVSLGMVLITFGLGLLPIALWQRKADLGMMGLFLLNLGFVPLQESQLKQLLLDAPLAWQYFAAGNYFLLPVTMAGFIHARFGPGRWKLRPTVWGVHLAYVLVALGLALGGVINLSSCYIYFDGLALLTLFGLTVSVLEQARKGGMDLRLLAGGVGFTYAVLVYNGLTAHGILPLTPRSEYLGPFVLGLCFIAIEVIKYVELKRGLARYTRELKELNETLEDRVAARTRELEGSNRTKDQFFAIIAHDLRGPVGALMGLLEEYAKEGERVSEEDLRELHSTAVGVHGLLNNLLTWARGQRGEIRAHPEELSLEKLCAETVRIAGIEASRKGVQVEVAMPPGLRIWADREMALAVLRNLLSNATKFSYRGGKVRLLVKEVGDRVRVSCLDDGVGIPAEALEKLFKPEQRSTPGTSGEGGTGLGLMLCELFVELNGGQIGADSAAGRGTRIWFTLPAVK